MAGEESIIFWAGAVIFLLSAAYFLFSESRMKSGKWAFQDETFVSFFTVASYVVMALGLSVTTSADGQPIYWTRWLFYIASCAILATEVARIAGKRLAEIVEVAILIGLVMLLGFLASAVNGPEKWLFFGLSTLAYLGMLALLLRWEAPDYRPFRGRVMGFIILFWSLFPVVWVLAPTGFGLISPPVEALLYGLLDVITKIGFGLYVLYSIKTADIPGRQKMAMRTESAPGQ
jgi:sensory rhodopsin